MLDKLIWAMDFRGLLDKLINGTIMLVKAQGTKHQGRRGNFEKSGGRRSKYAVFPSLPSSVP